MLYQADWILPIDSPPLRRGWVRVQGDRIAAIGPEETLPHEAGNEDLKRFPGCVLLPGFINAHCHLELSSLHNQLPSGKSFPVWVDALRTSTAGFEASQYRDAANEGIKLLLGGGTTTVVDVGNTGEALPALAESPLRAFALMETLGLDPSLADSRFKQAAAVAARFPASSRFRSGVTPHAAYSCSPELLQAVLRASWSSPIPFSLHACESQEEADLFASASGPLQEFCRRIFPAAPAHHDTTPLRWLESRGLLPDRTLIVHGNHLDEHDIALLVRRKATVVHCPSSHAFFGHKPFPYAELIKQGVPVCLGTDSLASGDSLSMWEQIRLLRKSFPEITASEAVRMATLVPSQALPGGEGEELGRLRAGCRADFLAIRTSTGGPTASSEPFGEDIFENILKNGAEIAFSMVDGNEIALSF